MKKIINYLPFHFLVGLIFGIILQVNFSIWNFGFVKLFFVVIILFLTSIFLHRLAVKLSFSFTIFITFVFIGISLVYIKNPKNYTNYYANCTNSNSFATLRISKILKPNNYNHKYEAEVIQINNQKTIGRILLNIKKDSLQTQLNINDQIYLKPDFKELTPPKNPHQFDYQSYLAKRQIYQQVFTSKKYIKLLKGKTFSLNGISSNIRNYIQQKLQYYHFSKDELAIINALLLGQRKEISKELLTNYTNAGAIHILAISGLHIGILLGILIWLFKPLERIKNGKIYQSILIILILWLFAFIAGLSASVVRAVTMFTFVTIGISIRKKQFIEHSLATSMFVLLLVKPMFIFDVGFQLSYLAVFSIVWLQPLLYRIWKPSLKPLDYFWKLITVSVSAQIGIFPISLYYFHQFPSLFLLSNLIIIPVLGGILIGGIITIVLALLNILPQFIADFYGWIISLLNNFVNFVSNQEEFLFKQIGMSFSIMLCWYLVILSAYILLINKRTKSLIYLLTAIVLLQSAYFFEKYQRNLKNEIIVFHKNRNSIIGNRTGKKLKLYSDLDTLHILEQNIIKNYTTNEQTLVRINNKIPYVFKFNNQPILIIDSLGIYNIKIKNSIVLLRQSPKIDLCRLITKLHPKKIIADGSNYKSYVRRWEKTCKNKKTPFYYTGQNGAYIISD